MYSSETSVLIESANTLFLCSMLCEVDRSYIEDGFNLYGLRHHFTNFQGCLDIILDRTGGFPAPCLPSVCEMLNVLCATCFDFPGSVFVIVFFFSFFSFGVPVIQYCGSVFASRGYKPLVVGGR